jgi:hypothetical protein
MRTQIDANGTLVYFVAHGVCGLTETTERLKRRLCWNRKKVSARIDIVLENLARLNYGALVAWALG